MINMKIELAKQTSLNESLTEEIQKLKMTHQNEISVLQSTIDMQQNIISQLNERDVLKSTCSEMSHDQLELSFDGFEIIRSEAEEKNEELVRLIAKTTLELDEAKIRFEETKNRVYANRQQKSAILPFGNFPIGKNQSANLPKGNLTNRQLYHLATLQ